MSGLSELKLVTSKPIPKSSPREVRRKKLFKKLLEQLEMARCIKAGGIYEVSVTKRERDPETGETREAQHSKRIRPWWWTANDGKTHLTIRYGARLLELAQGRNAIETEGIDGVIRTLEIIMTAVQAGDLDGQIDGLTVKSSSPTPNGREKLTLRKTS